MVASGVLVVPGSGMPEPVPVAGSVPIVVVLEVIDGPLDESAAVSSTPGTLLHAHGEHASALPIVILCTQLMLDVLHILVRAPRPPPGSLHRPRRAVDVLRAAVKPHP